VSTVIRILEEKGFVGHDVFGRSHRYHPLLSKSEYQKRLMRNVLENVFSGSVTTMVSTLVDNEKLEDKELEEIRRMIDAHE
jgi:predicted transcriptional regulator